MVTKYATTPTTTRITTRPTRMLQPMAFLPFQPPFLRHGQQAEADQKASQAGDGESRSSKNAPRGLPAKAAFNPLFVFRRNQEGGLVLPLLDQVPVVLAGRVGVFRAGPGHIVPLLRLDAIL